MNKMHTNISYCFAYDIEIKSQDISLKSHKSSVPPFLIRFYVGVLFLLNYSDLHPCVSLYKHLMPHKEEFHYMSTQ